MTKEEKTLLLQDISARVLYGVKVQICDLKEYIPTVKGLLNDELFVQFDYITTINNGDSTYNIINDNVKPYLRPMSSMTVEEEIEYDATFDTIYINGHHDACMSYKSFDFLNKKMFDYRNLIGRGLGIDCTDLNIY